MVSSTLQVDGMTCTGCERRVHDAVMAVEGVVSVIVSHVKGEVSVDADATGQGLLIKAITDAGYAVKGEDAPPPASFTWRNGTTWRRSAHNTTWCLAGCAIGEFGTLARTRSLGSPQAWRSAPPCGSSSPSYRSSTGSSRA